MMSALLSVVGKKGSSKSEVLERLVVLLSQRGFRIGVLKHLGRDDIEIDEPGKDTYRYRTGGAETVVLAGRKRLALFSNVREEIPLNHLLNFFGGFDLVFLEGYHQEELPKLEVYGKDLGMRLMIEDLPHFSFDEIGRLVFFIEEKLLKKETEVTQ